MGFPHRLSRLPDFGWDGIARDKEAIICVIPKNFLSGVVRASSKTIGIVTIGTTATTAIATPAATLTGTAASHLSYSYAAVSSEISVPSCFRAGTNTQKRPPESRRIKGPHRMAGRYG